MSKPEQASSVVAITQWTDTETGTDLYALQTKDPNGNDIVEVLPEDVGGIIADAIQVDTGTSISAVTPSST